VNLERDRRVGTVLDVPCLVLVRGNWSFLG
jgi:hypothetical protein